MNPLLVDDAVRAALNEDLGLAGDLTTQAIVAAGVTTTAVFRARKAGRVAGLALAEAAFRLIDPSLRFSAETRDGAAVAAGATIASVSGSARSILFAERVALNFMGRLSGIATATAAYVERAAGTTARIVCTRKTTPLLRAFEKHAVMCGGGSNHRFGLFDAVLIKDNHIAVAGGLTAALKAARQGVGHLVKIEVEVDTLDQLDEALSEKADLVLIDNFPLEAMREAVRRAKGRALLEASGSVTLDAVASIAQTGVDLISVGALTHSSAVFDIGLDIG